MAQNSPSEVLEIGQRIIAKFLEPFGFVWFRGDSGKGSGGQFASGFFERGDRRLELHYRWNLGLVSYHVGQNGVSHEEYMRSLGHLSEARYPAVFENQLEAFEALTSDVRNFCEDFVSGSGDSIKTARKAADQRLKLSGLARLESK
ncbi:MAG: hypothetical protein ABL936_07175 [Aestuariivirga sp.]